MVEYPHTFTSKDDALDIVEVIKFLGALFGDDAVEQFLRDKKGELFKEDGTPRSETAKTRWYKWILDKNKGLDDAFERVRKRAEPVGYCPSLLWTGPAALPAYRHLIETIQVTGRVDDYVMGLGLADTDNEQLIAIAWMLARQAGCDCWSLYGWDRRVNLPILLGSQNLWYPEATVGTCWVRGVVRDSLLGDPSSEPVVEIKTLGGRFQEREGVQRAWTVVLRTACLRAVLFLNWRDPAREESAPEPASGVRLPPDEAGLVDVPQERWHEADILRYPRSVRGAEGGGAEPRDLFLSVRYVNGWLAQEQIQVAGPRARRNKDRVRTIAEQVATPFKRWLLDDSPDRTRLSLADLESLTVALGSIFDQAPSFKRVYGCDPDSKRLILPARDQDRLATRDGKPPPHREIELPTKGQGVLDPGSSLVAQSMVWKTSILLRDIPRGRRGDTARPSLLDVRLNTSKVEIHDEVVVPVLSQDHTPIGGFVVATFTGEDRVGIDVEHVRWLEILSFLVGGLYSVCVRPDAETERKILFEMLLEDGAKLESSELLFRLTEWIRETTGAELVHVLVYDDDRGVFLPRAISAGDALCAKLVREEKIDDLPRAKLGRPIGRALKGVLTPARRGRSWQIFYKNEPISIPHVEDEKTLPEFTRANFASVYGMPLACFDGIAAGGVIWICFKERRDPPLTQAMRDRVDRVAHVVASLCAAHRFNQSGRNATE